MNRRIVIFALLCVLALGGISAVVHMHNKTGNQEKMNTDVQRFTLRNICPYIKHIGTQMKFVIQFFLTNFLIIKCDNTLKFIFA